MAVDALKRKAVKQEEADALLTDAISSEQGIEVLTRAISSGFPQLAVSVKDLEVMMEQAQIIVKTPEDKANRPQHSRPELTTAYVAPSDEMEEKLVNIWKDFLGVDKVGIHDNFFELGATSMDIVQVNERINKAFNSNIPIVDLFENPSISLLVRKLSQVNSEDNNAVDLTARTDQVQEGKQLIQKRLQRRKKGN
jgi:acyl carrier protein